MSATAKSSDEGRDRREQDLPEEGQSSQPDSLRREVAVPEQVIVSMAEIAESAKEGRLGPGWAPDCS